MDVRLPDGTIIRGVPDGMSKADLTAKLQANGYDVSKLAQEAAPSEGIPQQRQAAPMAAPPQEQSFLSQVGQGMKDVYGGAIRGAGSIGATLIRPFESAEENAQRRQAMDDFMRDVVGANPESFGYQGGKIAGEVAGTGGIGPGSAKILGGEVGAKAMPFVINALNKVGGARVPPALINALNTIGGAKASPEIVNAFRTGGFGAGNFIPKVTAGAVTGGATAGLINPEDATTGAGIGAALPAGGKAVPAIAKAVAPTTVQEAFTAGKDKAVSFLDNLRKKVPQEEVLNTVKQGLSKIQLDNSAAYVNAKAGWAADPTPLDFSKIDQAVKKIDDSMSHAGKSIIGSDEQKVIQEAKSAIDEWKVDHPVPTAVDLDALKRRLNNVYPQSKDQKQAQRAIAGMVDSVKSTITDSVPGYAEAMKFYDTQMDMIREIDRALGAGDKVSKETALNKIMQTLKSTPAGEYKQSLLGQLEAQGGVNVRPAIAGQLLSDIAPRSLTGRGVLGAGGFAAMSNPAFIPALALTSPRVMGEAAYGVANAMAPMARNAIPLQQIMLNALRQNNQPGQQ